MQQKQKFQTVMENITLVRYYLEELKLIVKIMLKENLKIMKLISKLQTLSCLYLNKMRTHKE